MWDMKLNNTYKILVGLATLWVMLYPLLFLCVWLTFPLSMLLPESTAQEFPFAFVSFFAVIPFHCFTIFLQMALSVFYLVHVLKNVNAAETVRIVLGVGVFFLPYVAMPIYYYLYIWREQPPAWAVIPAPVLHPAQLSNDQEQNLPSN
jgi:hypothetical protein